MKLSLFLLLFILLQSKAWSILNFEDAVAPEIVTSARALALGNAYLNKVDDGWAAFYNPAGLGTVRGLQFHIANAHLELNNGLVGLASDGGLTDSLDNFSNAFDVRELRSLHADNPGKISHARFQLFPNLTYRGLTLGYLYVQQNRARLRSLTSDYEVAERTDSGPVIAVNASLYGGILKFGASAIHLTRKELQKDFAPTDPVNIDKNQDVRKGSMTLITAGMRLTLPYKYLPTFSTVLRNSSQTSFDSPEFAGTPNEIPQTVAVSYTHLTLPTILLV